MKLNIFVKEGIEIEENIFFEVFDRTLVILDLEKDNDDKNLNLRISDDAEVKELNYSHRGIDKTTDVLSFGYMEEEDMDAAGDIIISFETAEKQAEERGVSFEDELKFLFVHGFLHVMGYEHGDETSRKEMFDLTDEIMGKKLPPYPPKAD